MSLFCPKVNNIAESIAVRKLLAKKPIVTTAHCHKSVPTSQNESDGSVFLKNVNFVVLINTAHPLIAAQLDLAFQTAEECLKERKMFRITVCICHFEYLPSISFFSSFFSSVEPLRANPATRSSLAHHDYCLSSLSLFY